MIDLKLTADWDLAAESGDLELIRDQDQTVQHIKQRLLTFLSEWFLDLDVGLPWLEEILEKPADISTVETILQGCVRESPGVAEVLSFEIVAADAERAIRVNFIVRLLDGSQPTIELEI